MDPNANLQEQERILARKHTPCGVDGPTQADIDQLRADHPRLIELRWALRDWLYERGGFEPDWSACPNARKFYGK